MAIYEYDCPRCGTFEVSQKMSEPALEVHPECGEKVARRISLTSFALKGGGWHSDGYASTGKRDPSQAGPACGSGACGGSGCAAASS
jgi:putative FmdB family regulatory protein